MKKLVSLVIALLMLTTTVFAAELPKRHESADFDGGITLNINASGADVSSEVNDVLLLLDGTEIECNGSFIQDNYTVIQGFVDMNITTGLFSIPFKVWVDVDFTDLDNFKYEVIVELPDSIREMISANSGETGLDKPYYILDYAKLLNSAEMGMTGYSSDMLNSVFTTQAELQTTIIEIIENLIADLEIVSYGDNQYRLQMNDSEAKEFIINYFDEIMGLVFNEETMSQMFGNEDEFMAEQGIDQINAELPKIYNIIRNVEIFPGDGIIYEYALDDEGYATYENMEINVKVDAADWAMGIAEEYPEIAYYMPPVDAVFNAVIETDTNYSNINAVDTIEYPELTTDNCIDLTNLMLTGMYGYESSDAYESYDVYDVYEPVLVYVDNEYVYFPDAKPELLNGRTMVPASILFNALGGEMLYTVEDGMEVIAGYLDGNEVVLIIGSDIAYVNGEEVKLDVAAFINSENRTMVPLRFIAENFGLSVEYVDSDAMHVFIDR